MPEDDAPGMGAGSSDVAWDIDPAEDAIKHWDLYRETGQRASLDVALGLWEASLARMPPDSPDRAAALNNVATALTARYEIGHARDDLDRGVALAKEALDLTRLGVPERSTRASNLAVLLLHCFSERGDRRDLDYAVTTLRYAASGADGPSAERALCLTNLGNVLKCRYENFGLREDLEEAVEAAREAADYTSAGGVEYVERYDLLASTLELRYLADSEPDDLDTAVTHWESALAGRGGSALRATTMFAAGRGFLRRWRLRGEDGDRARAGRWLTLAYMYGSDDARPLALEALAAASPEPAASSAADLPPDAGAIIDQIMYEVSVFERTHAPPPLNRAVKGYELVLQHPQLQLPTALRALLTSNAGCLIMGQYDDTLAAERLDEAVALFEEAVEAGRAAGGAEPWHVRHLGNALCWRYDRLRIASDLRRGLELLEEALANASPGDPLRAIVETDLEHAHGLQDAGGAVPTPELDVSDEPAWGLADVILGTYEVRGVHSGGGMGLVYRVWHRDSQRDLALKRPRSELFRTEGDKARFRDEAETWVGLGLHPHVVACDYVRTIEGLPCVFAEYLPAGSLADWERDGRLYAGSNEQSLRRIVDAAIQLAWGLAYAHQSEVVHRDVKPANALMTADGTLKVSDFGLARARSAAREQPNDDALSSQAVSAGGFTLAYASPEQIAREQVTAATDVWSWATSVLEMFAGEVTWLAGVAAPAALELHLSAPPAHAAVPTIPAVVTDLLRRSFVRDPASRPSMADVANELVRAYGQLTGEHYPRPAPHRAELLADGLSNHALSMLDLDNPEAASDLWESALGADPQHPHTTYNYGLLAWRMGAQTDTALVEMLEAVRTSHQGEWLPDYLLGLVHLERAAAGTATLHFRQALAAAPDHAAEIGAALRVAEGPEYDTVLHELRGRADALELEADPDAPQDVGYTTACALSADSTMLAIGYSTGVVVVWNVAPVYPIARLHPDGESEPTLAVGWTGRAVIAGDRHGVSVCDVDSHACVRTLGREDAFSTWAFAGECGVGVAECNDEHLEVWDLRAGRCLRRLSKPKASSLAVAIRRDGRIAVLGGADGIVRVYDVTTRRSLYAFDSNSGAIEAVAVSADGSTVLSGAQNGTVVSWDLGSGQPRRVLDVGTGSVSALALSDDGTTALVGTSLFGESGSAHVWELASRRCVHTLAAGDGPVRAVALSADGKIGCAAGDVDARVWSLGRFYHAPWSYARSEGAIERIKRADAVEAGVRRVEALVAQDNFMAAVGALDELRGTPGLARHPEVLECARRLSRQGRRGDLISVYRGPTLPVSGDEMRARANTLSIHDLARLTLRIHLGATLAVAISDDGDIAISGHADGTARTWDLTNGQLLAVAEPHPTAVVCVALSPDGSLAASSSGAVLRVWEATTGKPVTKLGEDSHAMAGDPRAMPFIMSARFGGDGRSVVVGHHNDTLEVWDLDARQRVRTLHLTGREALANCPVAVRGDSQFALAGSSTGTLALFDLNDGRCIWSTAAHADQVVAVAFLDDQHVFSAGADGAARLGEIRDGLEVNTIDMGVDWRGAIAVTGDGRAALVATDGLRVWDLRTGRSSLTLPGHASPFSCLALSRDGYIGLSASQDGEIRMWRLDWEVVFGRDANHPER